MKAQLLQWKRVTSSQHDEPTHKKPLKPLCVAIVRLRRTESTTLAMKEGHLFPTWWANPQKTSETSVFGNSAVSTCWKHSPCTDRGCLLSNYVSCICRCSCSCSSSGSSSSSSSSSISSSISSSSSSSSSTKWQKHICEVDEERSGNVAIVVESIRCLIDCNVKHAYQKNSRGWLGFTNWGGRPSICGGDTSQGGYSLSELPKSAFFN